jgi:hypothetical protein
VGAELFHADGQSNGHTYVHAHTRAHLPTELAGAFYSSWEHAQNGALVSVGRLSKKHIHL